MDTLQQIEDQIKNNQIVLYMKGSPDIPQCGFSATAVNILMQCGKKFAYVDVLANPHIRAELPKYANWPTFPQLWINGELIGGCDIISEMFNSGELQAIIENEVANNES